MVLLLGDAIDVDMVATDPLKENGYEFLHMYIFISYFCGTCNCYFNGNGIPAWGAPDDEEGDCNIEIDAGEETEGDDKRFPFVVLVACCAMRRFCCCVTDDLVVGILSCILLLPCQAFCIV